MNTFVFVALFAAFAAANAGVIPATSLVSAYSTGPLVSSVVSPVVSAYSAPVLAGGLVGEQTVVAGPSGTISRTVGGPVVSSYATPVVSSYAAPVVSSYAAPVVSSYAAPLVARNIW